MGKITNALHKAAEERMHHIERVSQIKEQDEIVIEKMNDSQIDSRIISYFAPKAQITEQYKTLRTNVLSLDNGKPTKTIVITSSVNSEGKTITALNLAISMAHSVHKPRILLIDADLRKGRLARYLGVKQHVGLSELLLEKAKLEDALFKIDLENLTFISSGSVPQNPVELLASQKMKDLLAELKTHFDYILLDTPPLVLVTDAVILGSVVDGVLLIIQAGRTQRGIVRHAVELLQQSKSRLLGYVLTNIEYHLPEYIYRYL